MDEIKISLDDFCKSITEKTGEDYQLIKKILKSFIKQFQEDLK